MERDQADMLILVLRDIFAQLNTFNATLAKLTLIIERESGQYVELEPSGNGFQVVAEQQR